MNWQPIETAPKDGTEVFAVVAREKGKKPYHPAVVKWCDECSLWEDEGCGETAEWGLTHWVPLSDLEIPTTGGES